MGFGGHLWEYYVQFWKCRHQPECLVVCFEDIQKHLSKYVPFLADFAGLECDAKLVDIVTHNSSLAVMSSAQHLTKYNDSWIRAQMQRSAKPGAIPIRIANKVTKGHRDKLTPELLAELDRKWKELVTPHTGHASYADMAAELLQEQKSTLERLSRAIYT